MTTQKELQELLVDLQGGNTEEVIQLRMQVSDLQARLEGCKRIRERLHAVLTSESRQHLIKERDTLYKSLVERQAQVRHLREQLGVAHREIAFLRKQLKG